MGACGQRRDNNHARLIFNMKRQFPHRPPHTKFHERGKPRPVLQSGLHAWLWQDSSSTYRKEDVPQSPPSCATRKSRHQLPIKKTRPNPNQRKPDDVTPGLALTRGSRLNVADAGAPDRISGLSHKSRARRALVACRGQPKNSRSTCDAQSLIPNSYSLARRSSLQCANQDRSASGPSKITRPAK
jgi:hypothetical protein